MSLLRVNQIQPASGVVVELTGAQTDAGGDVIGTTDTQTLTNKTVNADNNTISNLVHGAEVDNPSSGVHGVTGTVVGTTDTQTLTNKTIAGANVTDNLVISAGKGVDFSAVEGGGASSSVLDDYEEGTWTSSVIDSNDSSIVVGGSGRYIKVGAFVFLTFRIFDSAADASVGYPYINLPFPPISSSHSAANIAFTDNMPGGAMTVYFIDGNNILRLSTSVNNPHLNVVSTGTTSTINPRMYGSFVYYAV